MPQYDQYDTYIAIDFSGAKDAGRQKGAIALAEAERGGVPRVETPRFTRFDVVWYLLQRLLHHNAKGRRVLFGFDFSYSFPRGFWGALTAGPDGWSDILNGLANGIVRLPPVVEKPESNAREWAEAANERIARRLGTPKGPFWGPGSSQPTNPGFPYTKVPFEEYRLVERRGRGLKQIFQIGGQGTVGLQSLCGMPYLFHIRTTCAQQRARLHCWPFDGWVPDASAHCLVEFYPTLYNQRPRSHESDALACVEWAMDLDEKGHLEEYLSPELDESERSFAATEGWVLGIL